MKQSRFTEAQIVGILHAVKEILTVDEDDGALALGGGRHLCAPQ
jgi:hypothetical protein